VDTLISFLILDEMLCFSLLSTKLAIQLSYTIFVMLRCESSILSFFRALIMKGCWILSKTFSTSIDDYMILVLTSVYMLYYIYLFAYVEPSLHSWNATHLHDA
jgi:hypothetical protein